MSVPVPDVVAKPSRASPTPREFGNAQLMLRVQDDDKRAFEALYDRFAGRARGFALSITRDDARAQDVVQEAFLSVWRSRSKYTPERGPVESWIMGAVRNRSIDALRRDRRHETQRAMGEGLEHLQAPGDLERAIVERDQAMRLRARLVNLPDTQKTVITLAYFGELSTSEIARRLSIPHGTVKGRMRLGLKQLRATCEEHSLP